MFLPSPSKLPLARMSGLVLGQRDEPAGHRLSQEEILGSTRLVSQGLEALHSEHQAVLQSLSHTIECLQQGGHEEGLVHEKARQLRRSMENIELGLSEAQVRGSKRSSCLIEGLGSLGVPLS